MKYFKVFVALMSLSLKRYLENRLNAFGYATSHIISLLLSIIFIHIYFSFSSSIAGWEKYQVIFLMGLFMSVSSIFLVFFRKNVISLPEYIQNGGLDIFLTKPISSQFYLSFRIMRVYDVFTVLTGLAVTIYSLNQMNREFSILNYVLLGVGLVSGLVILYSMFFMIATLAIWLVKFDVLPDLYNTFQETLSIPTDFYGSRLSSILTFVLPLGLILTIPAKVFFQQVSIFFLIYSITFAIISLILSSVFWNFALKHYTSASS